MRMHLIWFGVGTVAGVDEDEAMYTFQDKDILECEFYVIETLQFDLILHHPFRPLLQYGAMSVGSPPPLMTS